MTDNEKFNSYKRFIFNTIKDEPATKTAEFKQAVEDLRNELITIKTLMNRVDDGLAQILNEFSEIGVLCALNENF